MVFGAWSTWSAAITACVRTCAELHGAPGVWADSRASQAIHKKRGRRTEKGRRRARQRRRAGAAWRGIKGGSAVAWHDLARTTRHLLAVHEGGGPVVDRELRRIEEGVVVEECERPGLRQAARRVEEEATLSRAARQRKLHRRILPRRSRRSRRGRGGRRGGVGRRRRLGVHCHLHDARRRRRPLLRLGRRRLGSGGPLRRTGTLRLGR